jgi:hypothetical protein
MEGHMQILTRKSFSDRSLSADDLAALGDQWLTWYKALRRRNFVRNRTSQQLEIRLWGFPRSRAASLLVTLQKRIASAGLPIDCASLANPDTLIVTFPAAPFQSQWPRRSLAELVAEPDVDGLDVQARVSVRAGAGRTSQVTWALVARGLIRDRQFLLKALCQADGGGMLERLAQRSAWRGEGDCLLSLDDRDRSSHPVMPSGVRLQRPGSERSGLRLAELIVDLPGNDKLQGFLRRVGIWSAVLAGGVGLAVFPFGALWGAFWIGVFLIAAGICGLGFNLGVKALEIILTRRGVKSTLRNAYAQPATYPHLDLAMEEVANNPVNVKYAQELTELGAVHYFDSRTPMTRPCISVSICFRTSVFTCSSTSCLTWDHSDTFRRSRCGPRTRFFQTATSSSSAIRTCNRNDPRTRIRRCAGSAM